MPSATLPPELQQIARDAPAANRRAAAHGDDPRPRPLPARPRSCPTAAIAERIGVDDDWIVKRTGIHSRRRAAAERAASTDMAVVRRPPRAAGRGHRRRRRSTS